MKIPKFSDNNETNNDEVNITIINLIVLVQKF